MKLSNIVINNFFLNNDIKGYCLSADELKKPNIEYRTFIYNYDDSNGKGSHWILIYFKPIKHLLSYKPYNHIAYYFDSSGAFPEFWEEKINNGYDTNFIKYMKKYSKEIIYNNVMIQPPNSDTCGYYCCIAAYYFVKLNYTLKDFIKIFDEYDLYANDILIKNIYKILK